MKVICVIFASIIVGLFLGSAVLTARALWRASDNLDSMEQNLSAIRRFLTPSPKIEFRTRISQRPEEPVPLLEYY